MHSLKIFQTEFLKFEIFNSNNLMGCDKPVDEEAIKKFWNDLFAMKFNLEVAKTEIDKYATHRNYQTVWNSTDLYGYLKWDLKNYDAQFVTNAWIKYYELWNIIKPRKDIINIFCNAELPGASISAFNHYCDTHDLKYHWWASSYMPDGVGTMLGDTYGIFKANRNNWLMNEKNNGDCTVLKNLLDFEKRIGPESEIGGMDLYSHDAGLDISPEEYNKQEEKNTHLHLGCALAGFLTLRRNGNFVAKQYTYFTKLNIELIVLYSTMFEKFYITKPLTSRPYNSEIYLVGLKFIGMPDTVRKLLEDRVSNFHFGDLLNDAFICESTYQQILKSLDIFKNQILYINQNVGLLAKNINNKYYKKNNFKAQAKKLIAAWIKNNPISPLKHPLIGS